MLTGRELSAAAEALLAGTGLPVDSWFFEPRRSFNERYFESGGVGGDFADLAKFFFLSFRRGLLFCLSIE